MLRILFSLLLWPCLVLSQSYPLEALNGLYDGGIAGPFPERIAQVDLSGDYATVSALALSSLGDVTPGILELCDEPWNTSEWSAFPSITLEDEAGVLAEASGGRELPDHPWHWSVFVPLEDDTWERAVAGPLTVRMCWYPEDYVLIYCPQSGPSTLVSEASLVVVSGQLPNALRRMSDIKRLYR